MGTKAEGVLGAANIGLKNFLGYVELKCFGMQILDAGSWILDRNEGVLLILPESRIKHPVTCFFDYFRPSDTGCWSLDTGWE